MSSKAAPRKAGAIFAAALALASVFNAGASAADTFRVGGNVSGPVVTDQYGIQLPGCRNGSNQKVKFTPKPVEYFADKNLSIFDYQPSYSIGEDEGPEVYYNYLLLQMLPASFRNFALYQACIINYYSDQGLRRPINPIDYTIDEIKADCSAIIRLREENRVSAQDLEMIVTLIGAEDRPSISGPITPKAERRIRNVTQCYYYNTTAENITPAPRPRRG